MEKSIKFFLTLPLVTRDVVRESGAGTINAKLVNIDTRLIGETQFSREIENIKQFSREYHHWIVEIGLLTKK